MSAPVPWIWDGGQTLTIKDIFEGQILANTSVGCCYMFLIFKLQFLALKGAQEMLIFVCSFVCPCICSVQVCLEQSIFIFLAQIFKKSVRNQSAVSKHSESTQKALIEHSESTQLIHSEPLNTASLLSQFAL